MADDGDKAFFLLYSITSSTFKDGFINQPGLFSASGSTICYFRDACRNPANLGAHKRVSLSDYTVTHYVTDMYHHRNFRGAYTKTLTPSGTSDIATRVAVGLYQDEENS